MKAKRGFTLIEAIIALTIFTILIAALSLAMSVALKADSITHQREDDSGTVRAVFDALTRDVQAAFASPNSPASVFIAGSGGSSSGSSVGGGGLLTLTTLTQHIQADSLTSGDAQTQDQNSAPTSAGGPQSDMALVQYSLVPGSDGTQTLTRSVTPVPNAQLLSQSQNSDPQSSQTALAEHIVDLTLQFYDQNQQTERSDWDYEQANQQASNVTSSASGGTSAPTTPSTTGDSVLPLSVKATIRIKKKDGSVAEFTTTIPIVAVQPQPATNAIPTSGGTTSSATPGG